jgi:hypothetical protein
MCAKTKPTTMLFLEKSRSPITAGSCRPPNSIPPQRQRRANPLFRGAFEQRAELSFGIFLASIPLTKRDCRKEKYTRDRTGNDEHIIKDSQ